MRRPLSLAAVLACVLFAGGCVSVPADVPPPVPRLDAAAVHTPSPSPATQASARTALVATTPVRKAAKRPADRRAAQPRPAGATGREHSRRMPQAQQPQQPHRAVRAAPARPAPPRTRHRGTAPTVPGHRSTRPHPARPRPARPRSTYDLRTVCGWAHRVPASAGAASLCDSYVR
ncbi:hypothetical protein [Streptomyces sp. NPDC020597]|uniref:hypothetical protein n=1 Tax=unclassified Streptomyces TaxID=2593676 RepID=UPI0037AE99BC